MPDRLTPELRDAISIPRLSTYEAIVGNGNSDDALLLYRLNVMLSGAFIFPLQSLEVALRNSIATKLDVLFGTDDWLLSKRKPPSSAIDPMNPDFWSKSQLDKIQETHDRLQKLRNASPTQGAMIADLDFGFWTTFLDKFYHRLWPHIESAFPNRPTSRKRGLIANELNDIRRFRNRIAHHEIIINYLGTPLKPYNKIIDVLSWVCTDKANWTKEHCKVDKLWACITEARDRRGWSGP